MFRMARLTLNLNRLSLKGFVNMRNRDSTSMNAILGCIHAKLTQCKRMASEKFFCMYMYQTGLHFVEMLFRNILFTFAAFFLSQQLNGCKKASGSEGESAEGLQEGISQVEANGQHVEHQAIQQQVSTHQHSVGTV